MHGREVRGLTNRPALLLAYDAPASAIWRWLLKHLVNRAVRWTAAIPTVSSPMRIARIATTTNSSVRENARQMDARRIRGMLTIDRVNLNPSCTIRP